MEDLGPTVTRGRSGASFVAVPSRRRLPSRASTPSRIALTKAEAAGSIGVSVDFFEAHVQPDLAVVREGRKVLIPVAEVERWVAERAVPTLPEA